MIFISSYLPPLLNVVFLRKPDQSSYTGLGCRTTGVNGNSNVINAHQVNGSIQSLISVPFINIATIGKRNGNGMVSKTIATTVMGNQLGCKPAQLLWRPLHTQH